MLERRFFQGFIRVHILHNAGLKPIFGVQMILELKRHGYNLSPGTLYPILHEMESEGYLRCEGRNVNGKIRKYYSLTRKGRNMLKDVKKKIDELVSEVLV